MDSFVHLLLNAIALGILLGGIYAAIALGLSIMFGLLDIPNLAHPAFVIVGAYAAYAGSSLLGLDPILASLLLMPLLFLCGMAIFYFYHRTVELRSASPLQGISIFFGLLVVLDVVLILSVGTDPRAVETAYTQGVVVIGWLLLPKRFLVPFAISIVLLGAVYWVLRRTFFGMAIVAVAQQPTGARLMSINPFKVKMFACGLATAVTAPVGAALILLQPVEPALSREYLGRIFAICVLGGLGSTTGLVLASITLGIAEAITSTFFGPSWAPAVAFTALLLTLAFRPSGLFAR